MSSHRTSDDDDDDADDFDEDDDEAPKKRKGKGKATPTAKKGAAAASSTSAGASGISFLTAAEQREQDKKDDKKAAETPYSFLLNITDVCDSSLPSCIILKPVLFNRKMGRSLENRTMTPGQSEYRRRRGPPLHRLRNRYDRIHINTSMRTVY